MWLPGGLYLFVELLAHNGDNGAACHGYQLRQCRQRTTTREVVGMGRRCAGANREWGVHQLTAVLGTVGSQQKNLRVCYKGIRVKGKKRKKETKENKKALLNTKRVKANKIEQGGSLLSVM